MNVQIKELSYSIPDVMWMWMWGWCGDTSKVVVREFHLSSVATSTDDYRVPVE
jgi:hypothetical protein